jgi:hypothetical protein
LTLSPSLRKIYTLPNRALSKHTLISASRQQIKGPMVFLIQLKSIRLCTTCALLAGHGVNWCNRTCSATFSCISVTAMGCDVTKVKRTARVTTKNTNTNKAYCPTRDDTTMWCSSTDCTRIHHFRCKISAKHQHIDRPWNQPVSTHLRAFGIQPPSLVSVRMILTSAYPVKCPTLAIMCILRHILALLAVLHPLP